MATDGDGHSDNLATGDREKGRVVENAASRAATGVGGELSPGED